MDDLLDIDWSKQSSSGNGKNGANGKSDGRFAQTSGGMAARQTGSAGTASSTYNFDALTRSMPSSKSSYITHRPSSATSVGAAQKPPAAAAAPSSLAGPDAFSSLLGFGASATPASNATMSMADRLRQGNTPSPSLPAQARQTSSNNSDNLDAWAGLEDLIGTSSSKPNVPKTSVPRAKAHDLKDDAWDFATDQDRSNAKKDAASTQAKVQVKPKNDPFDFSEFEDPGDHQSSALGGDQPTIRHSAPATKFEDGGDESNRQAVNDFLDDSGDLDDEADGILGSLGRPARPLSSKLQESEYGSAPRSVQKSQHQRQGTASPPPHIVGQVVEMGFSPQQAREALGRTADGQDVAAAVEMLLRGTGKEPDIRTRGEREPIGQQQGQRSRREHAEDAEERDRQYAIRVQREENSRRATGQRDTARDPAARQRIDNVDSNMSSRSDTPVDWQKQADQLYAQASEMGANMFSKANALWASAKSQAQKALDESNLSSGQNSGRSSPATGSERARNRRWAVPTRDGGGTAKREWQGKPKWMIDAEEKEEEEEEGRAKSHSKDVEGPPSSNAFRDDDDDLTGEVREAPSFLHNSQAQNARLQVQPGNSSRSTNVNELRQERREVDLLKNQSEERGKAPTVTAAAIKRQTPSPAERARKNGAAPTKSVASRPPTLRQRALVEDDASAVQASLQQKARGNELFKRGAYGEAEGAYSAALSALDANQSSIRRVALFNNRANARIKNGDAKGALDDTMAVLRLIVVEGNARSSPFLLYRPSQEAPLPVPDFAQINLREGYAKALLRRAQAEEMLERWDPALSVWSLLEKYEREEGSGSNGVTNMRAAQEGKGRCDKMLKGGDLTHGQMPSATTATSTIVNPRVRAAAAQAVAKAEAQAKARIRAENAALAEEDAAKDRLRDSVENRVLAWKTGKENNVRALLASLHDVVWPSLAWKRVGMHEVVMDNQVKKVYMRAIGKLHPDKLTPKNNSLEERMIGGAVFSVLNDAWAAAQK